MTPKERMYPTVVPSATVDAGVSAVFAEFEADTWRTSALREVVGVVAVHTAPTSVWELRHGGILNGATIGLYLTRDDAVAAADASIAHLLNLQANDPEWDTANTETIWDQVTWSEFTHPDFGYTETRGQYGEQSYFVLAPRTLGETRYP